MQAAWPATPSGENASYPTPTYEALAGTAETNPDPLLRPATPFVDRSAEPSDFRSQPPLYLRPIPKNPTAVANVPAPTRSQRPNEFAYPHYPVGLSDDPGTNGHGWFAQNSPDPSLFDQAPAWLRNTMAVPPSPHPARAPTLPNLEKYVRGPIVRSPNELIDRMLFAESGGNTYAKPGFQGVYDNKRLKGAVGAGQFTPGTWRDLLARYRQDLVAEDRWLDPVTQQHPETIAARGRDRDAENAGLLQMRTDYALSREMMANYANQLAGLPESKGFEVTPRNIYAMYFLGPGEGLKAMNAMSDNPSAATVDVTPIAANGNKKLVAENPTIGQLFTTLDKKILTARPDQLPFR
jgi:hypothetical protein